MFNHLHQKIILDYIRGRSLVKYRQRDVKKAMLNYYAKKTH
jgi:hypothetical protein